MNHVFRIREFAARAAVTVKTLHHYDRLGLLAPLRSDAGHRLYRLRDLSRVRQIAALKRLGFSLRRIGELLTNGVPSLPGTLRNQRRVLEDRRRDLDRAITILRQAECTLEGSTRNPSRVLDALIESLQMHDDIDRMQQYFDENVWNTARAHFDPWPSTPWLTLYRDINAALDAAPELPPQSDMAQSLSSRWLALDAGDTAVLSIRAGLRRAWADRERWPEILQRRYSDLQVERAARFVSEALWERWDAERVARERSTGVPAHVSESRRRLYREGLMLLDRDPSSEEVRQLAVRWESIVDDETGGDSEMKADMIRSFQARTRWPAGLVRSVAASYEMDPALWMKVAHLIETGHVARTLQQQSS